MLKDNVTLVYAGAAEPLKNRHGSGALIIHTSDSSFEGVFFLNMAPAFHLGYLPVATKSESFVPVAYPIHEVSVINGTV